jgi:hypothetical protein
MFEVFALFVSAAALAGSVYAIIHARKNLAEDLRIKRLLDKTPMTTIADAPSHGRVLIRGKVRSATGGMVAAPFTGIDALWARAAMQDGMGNVNRDFIETVEVLQVDDESGRVAHVPVRGANMRFELKSVTHRQLVKPYLATQGIPANTDLGVPYEAALPVDALVNVLGSVAETDDGYRTSSDVLVLSPGQGELIVFDPFDESGEASKHRRYLGCATKAIIGSALTCVVLLYLLLRG